MGDIYTNPPQSRNEAILRATIDGTEYTAPPQSRIEDLLLELKEAIEQGGTGEGDMKKSVYDSDNSVATAGGIKMFVNQKIGTLPQRVGSLETTAGVLEGEVASIEDTLDGLGTASTKNSTSVVTDSSDLVESGAVYDALGFGNKNLCNPETFVQGLIAESTGVVNNNANWLSSDFIPCSGVVTLSGYKDGSESNFCVRFAEYDSSKNFIKNTNNINISADAYYSRTITLNSNTRFVRITQGFDNKVTTPSTYFATNRVQIELGSTATPYEPYHASVSDSLDTKISYADNGILGAKNFWENNVLRNTSPKTTTGVTGTLNANETITITGHNTGTTNNVIECGEIDLKAGNYILSGNPANYEKARPQIYIDGSHVYHNLGGDTPFTVESDATNVKLRIYFTTAFTSDDTIVFKPMIRLADDTDSTYQPHAKTNRELTVNKADNSVIGTVEGANASKAWSVGEHFISGGQFKEVTNPIASGEAINSRNTTDKPIADCLFIKGIISSSNNLNDIIESGLYTIQTPPTNSPENVGDCGLIVHKAQTGHIRQMVFKTTEGAGYIYIRSYSGNPFQWNPWFKFNGTIVS